MRNEAKTDVLPELELMRSASFIAVVLQHVLGAYSRRPGLSAFELTAISLIFGLCKFAVPSFVFLSGMVLFLKYYGRLSYPTFILKRLTSVVVPYVLYSFFYYLPPKREFVKNLFAGNIAYHTWYVLLILQFYFFLPIIFHLYKALFEGKHTLLKTSAFCAAYAALLSFCGAFGGIPFVGAVMYVNRSRNLLFYLPYFILGGYAALNLDAFRSFVKKRRVYICALFTIYFAYIEIYFYRTSGFGNIGQMGSLNIRFFIFTVASILLLYGASVYACGFQKAKEYAGIISRHSYGAYLIHVHIINETNAFLLDFNLNYRLHYAILAIATVALSVLCATVLETLFSTFRTLLKTILSPDGVS